MRRQLFLIVIPTPWPFAGEHRFTLRRDARRWLAKWYHHARKATGQEPPLLDVINVKRDNYDG